MRISGYSKITRVKIINYKITHDFKRKHDAKETCDYISQTDIEVQEKGDGKKLAEKNGIAQESENLCRNH